MIWRFLAALVLVPAWPSIWMADWLLARDRRRSHPHPHAHPPTPIMDVSSGRSADDLAIQSAVFKLAAQAWVKPPRHYH